MCMKAPIVQQPDTLPDSCNLFSLLFSGKKKRRKKRQQNDDEFDDFDYDAFEEFDDDNEEGLSTDTGEFFRYYIVYIICNLLLFCYYPLLYS